MHCVWLTQAALLVHPAVDKQVYVFSVLDRSVVEAVVGTDSPRWLARQRSCPKLDVTLFMQTIICHRHVSTYLNSLFYLLDNPLTVLFSHQTYWRPLWSEQHPVQLQGSRLPVQIQNKENPCSYGPPCTRSWSLQSPSGPCTCEEDLPAVSFLWVCIIVSALAVLKMSPLITFPGGDIFQLSQRLPWSFQRIHPCQDPGSTMLEIIRACRGKPCPQQLLHLKLRDYLWTHRLIQVQVQVKDFLAAIYMNMWKTSENIFFLPYTKQTADCLIYKNKQVFLNCSC